MFVVCRLLLCVLVAWPGFWLCHFLVICLKLIQKMYALDLSELAARETSRFALLSAIRCGSFIVSGSVLVGRVDLLVEGFGQHGPWERALNQSVCN